MLRTAELQPNAENATVDELHVAMEAAPNKRSYIRLNAILEVVKAWIDPRLKRRRTIHHQGEGLFLVPSRTIKLPSPKTSFLTK